MIFIVVEKEVVHKKERKNRKKTDRMTGKTTKSQDVQEMRKIFAAKEDRQDSKNKTSSGENDAKQRFVRPRIKTNRADLQCAWK